MHCEVNDIEIIDGQTKPQIIPESPFQSRRDGDDDAKSDDDETVQRNSNDDGVPMFSFLKGIKKDFHARWPLYGDDWKLTTTSRESITTVIGASLFTFCIQFIPALIFAEIIERETYGNLSVTEVLLTTGIFGVIYATCAGQPIVVMGITGPIALLLGTSYSLTETFNTQYFPFLFWICIWGGILHILTATFGLVSLVRHVTPFTCQIFELFIGISFVYESLHDMLAPLKLSESDVAAEERSNAYASLFIGMITCYVAWTLHFAETSVYGLPILRSLLTSYNTLLAMIIGTAISYIPGIESDASGVLRVTLKAPWDWQPTADRPWIVDPIEGIDVQGILGAFIPGLMFFLLFFIDHNVTSILSQSPKFNLKKPSAYHLDFFVLGVTFFPCAMLGLPPGSGLIPQSPLHVRALCQRKHVVDSHGVARVVFTNCQEQRWSGLTQACLHFVALLCFKVINWIPKGSLYGLLLYLGLCALHGNEILERCCMSFIVAKKRPQIPIIRYVQWPIVSVYTLIQVLCSIAVFAVAHFAPIGYIYPLLLALLVPLRKYIVSRWFNETDLAYLDPRDESQQEYREEQREYHKTIQQECSINEDDMAFPAISEYRGIDNDNNIVGNLDDVGVADGPKK